MRPETYPKTIRVLLIEDNPGDARLIREMLAESTRVRFDVVVADRLSTGYHALDGDHFDIILLDLSLPDSHGLATLTQARQFAPSMPIVVLTGLDNDEIGLEAVSHGAQDYLLKGSVDNQGLARAIHYAIERKQLVEQLRAERDRARAYLDTASVILVALNTQGEITMINQKGSAVLEYEEQDLLGQNWFDTFLPEAVRDTVNSHFRRLMAGDMNASLEYFENPIITRSGETRIFAWHNALVYDESASISGVLSSGEDITARRQIEEALVAERTLLRTLIDYLPDPIYVKDTEGRFILENEAEARQMGAASTSEVVGKTGFDYYEPELAERYHKDDLAVMRSGQALINREEPATDVGGHQKWILTTKVPLRNANGEVIGLVGIGHDITDRKQTEDALEQYAKRLSILHSIDQAILAARSIEEVVNVVVSHIQQIVNPYELIVLAFNPDTEVVRTLAIGVEGTTQLAIGTELSPDEILGLDQLREGKTVQIEDLASYGDLPVIQSLLDQGIRSIVNVPFFAQGRLVGLIGLGHDQPGLPFSGHMELIHEVGYQLAVAINQSRLQEAEREQRHFSEALSETAATINSTLHLEAVLTRILESVARVIPYDAGDILLIEAGVAHSVYSRGYTERLIANQTQIEHLPLNDISTFQQIIETGQPLVIPDVYSHPGWLQFDSTGWVRSHVGVPIRLEGRVIGFINIDSEAPGFFTAIHAERLLAFADQAAVAIQNARLFADLEAERNSLEQRVIERTSQLNRARERIETILNSSSDVMILCRTDSVIDQVNPAFDMLFGYNPDETLNQRITMLAMPERAAILERAFAAVIDTQQPQRLEIIARRKDLTAFDADLVLSPIVENIGDLLGVVCSLRDITQRRRIEAQLRQTLEHEMELGELKSRYVSMAAHDLRNPLAVIQSAIDMMRHYGEKLTDDQIQAKYDSIQSNIKRMVDMLDDILIIGRVESGKLAFNPTQVDIRAFCQDLITQTNQAVGTTQIIDFSITGPYASAAVDTKLLHHILGNLLSNAIKYSPDDSEVRFAVHCEPHEITFIIEDHGIGIPQADQARLFEVFHRAQNVGATPGTGLGLAIVKQSVELHGGTIVCESRENQGTSFTVVLPTVN